MFITERMMRMFNPSEWKHTQRTINNSRLYINKHTGLPKLRNSFTREQQHQLDQQEEDKHLYEHLYRIEDK
jgi:hypothetical protein